MYPDSGFMSQLTSPFHITSHRRHVLKYNRYLVRHNIERKKHFELMFKLFYWPILMQNLHLVFDTRSISRRFYGVSLCVVSVHE